MTAFITASIPDSFVYAAEGPSISSTDGEEIGGMRSSTVVTEPVEEVGSIDAQEVDASGFASMEEGMLNADPDYGEGADAVGGTRASDPYRDASMICMGTCGKNRYDDICWTLYDDGSLVFIGQGEMLDCSVIDTDLGHWSWRSDPQRVKSVIVGDGITSIGKDVFAYCNELKSISLADTVESIGERAFIYCDFSSISLPGGLKCIDNQVFSDCEQLQTIELPHTLSTIGDYAFADCKNIASIVIPENVNSIGEGIFSGCDSLCAIAVAEGNKIYDSRENCNAIIKTRENCVVAGCKQSAIPSRVMRIGENAFYGCNELKSIEIGLDVREIAYFAFGGCKNLVAVKFPKSLQTVERCAFAWCNKLAEVNYDGTKEQWEKINIEDEGNESLLGAIFHFEDDDSAVGVRGDVTGDGIIGMGDVVKLARAVAGTVSLTAAEEAAADVTGDGKIGMGDVVKLARYVAKSIPSLG